MTETRIIINPGSGPVSGATEGHAALNMHRFIADLKEVHGLKADTFLRRSDKDYNADDNDGRFAFELIVEGENWTRHVYQIQMPGIPLAQVRWMDEASGNIWDFPRLYVDDSSWIWAFALNCCKPEESES